MHPNASGPDALLLGTCSPSALQINVDFYIHQLSGLRLEIDLRRAESLDLRFSSFLRVCDGTVLTTSGARLNCSAHLEGCPHATICGDGRT